MQRGDEETECAGGVEGGGDFTAAPGAPDHRDGEGAVFLARGAVEIVQRELSHLSTKAGSR
ncbi:hypothetical protein GCM10027047_27220 [Rhodococcus aerolatus]